MNLFSDNAGKVILVPDAGFPLAVSMDGWLGAPTMKAIITNVGIASQGNFQFMHTLRNFIYVYVFGERIGEMTIGGLAFAAACKKEGEGVDVSGLENVWNYYQKNRLSTLGTPVSIAIGVRMAFTGFLTGFSANYADPQAGLTQFSLRFHFIPPES